MNNGIARQAGAAFVWKVVQLAGIKAIYFARILILARLLSPQDFGLLAIAMIAVDVLLIITDFGMVPALVQRSQVDEQHYNAAWTVGIVRALIVAGVVILAAPLIAELFAEPRASVLIQVLALRPLVEASASIKIADLTRNLRFRSLAFIKLPDALINTIVSIVLAGAFSVWALVAGILAGAVISSIMSYVLAPHRPRLSLDLAAVSPLIRYGRWIFATGLIAVAGSSMLQLVISRTLGTVELGLYFLAAKLAFLPAEVASEVVGSVAFPLYARLQGDVRGATRAFQAILTGMAVVLIPVCALIIALAPSLVANILGSRWEGTVPLIRLLACASMVGLFGDAVVPILKGLGQPYKVAVLEVIQSSLLMMLVWILASRYGLVGAVFAWVPAIAASQFVCATFLRQILPHPFLGLRVPMIVIVVVSGTGAALAIGVDNLFAGNEGLVAAMILSVVTMAALLWLAERRLNLGLADDLLHVFPQLAALADLSRKVWMSKSKTRVS